MEQKQLKIISGPQDYYAEDGNTILHLKLSTCEIHHQLNLHGVGYSTLQVLQDTGQLFIMNSSLNMHSPNLTQKSQSSSRFRQIGAGVNSVVLSLNRVLALQVRNGFKLNCATRV